jgi:hypothetical protein
LYALFDLASRRDLRGFLHFLLNFEL